MSRLNSLFLFLVLMLMFLLFLYYSTSVYPSPVTPRPNGKHLVRVPISKAFKFNLESSLSSLSFASSDDSASSSDAIFNGNNGSVSLDESTYPSVNDGPIQVIVLARMRTGSTLCGEILNQNPDLFFLFEPLHELKHLFASQDTALSEEDKLTASANLLKKLFRCKFPQLYIQGLARWGIGKSKSKRVAPICKKTESCREATPKQFSQECNKSGNVAMKTIRADIKMLKPLVKSHKINLKVIHLMRDPRGTANSRRSYYSGPGRSRRQRPQDLPKERTLQELGLLTNSSTSRKNTIPKLCDWMRETLKDALEKPPWLNHRYKLVRYEDLAKDPLRLSRDIYKFIGFEMPQAVEEWIHKNTENDDWSSLRKFSTHKNSLQASASWRNKLSLEEVVAVQKLCGDVMDSLGYKKVYSLEDLQNGNLSLVEPISLGEDIMLT